MRVIHTTGTSQRQRLVDKSANKSFAPHQNTRDVRLNTKIYRFLVRMDTPYATIPPRLSEDITISPVMMLVNVFSLRSNLNTDQRLGPVAGKLYCGPPAPDASRTRC